MSKAMLFLMAALLGRPLLAVDMGAGSDSFKAPQRSARHTMDRNELRAAVDETQALLDALARETLALPKADHEALYKSLRDEYHLDKFVGKGRKSLEKAEEILEIQSAIKNQQALMKSLPVEGLEKEESKLIGMQSDLVGAVDDLRDLLREIHNNANEDEVRDLRNWVMVSEGQMRNQREDRALAAAAQASTSSAQASTSSAQGIELEGEELSAAGISPTAAAEPASVSPTATVTPLKKKP